MVHYALLFNITRRFISFAMQFAETNERFAD